MPPSCIKGPIIGAIGASPSLIPVEDEWPSHHDFEAKAEAFCKSAKALLVALHRKNNQRWPRNSEAVLQRVVSVASEVIDALESATRPSSAKLKSPAKAQKWRTTTPHRDEVVELENEETWGDSTCSAATWDGSTIESQVHHNEDWEEAVREEDKEVREPQSKRKRIDGPEWSQKYASFRNDIRAKLQRNDISGAEADLQAYLAECGDDDFMTSEIDPQLFNWIISAYAKRKDAKGAQYWLEAMERDWGVQPTDVTFNTVMNVCAMTGDTEGAEHWLSALLVKGLEPDSMSFNTVVKAYAKAGDLASAERWLTELGDEGQADAYTFCTVMNAYARIGDADRTEHWFNVIVERKLKLDSVAYGAVVNAHAKAGNVNVAEDWIEKMVSDGIQPDLRVYTPVVHAYAQAGVSDGVVRLFQQIRRHGVSPDKALYHAARNALSTQQMAAALGIPEVEVIEGLRSWTGSRGGSNPESCKFFLQGRCTRGQSCPYKHTEP